jgi:iron-regulated transporter 1
MNQHSPQDSTLPDQNLAQDSTLTDYHSVQVSWIIFLSRGLSAWGDRLWAFGIGIFMNLLGPKDLRLVAVYGFSTSVSIIFFGATIGRWIDRTERLTSAKTFLGIQNLV